MIHHHSLYTLMPPRKAPTKPAEAWSLEQPVVLGGMVEVNSSYLQTENGISFSTFEIYEETLNLNEMTVSNLHGMVFWRGSFVAKLVSIAVCLSICPSS